MKRLKKFITHHGYLLLIISLFAAGIFLRLYNFENRLIFGPEQAISLLTSTANLEGISLIGEPNLRRFTSTSHGLFSGAIFSFVLLPFTLLSNYRILPLTIGFAFLNIVTAAIFFFISKKLFGKTIAALALSFFIFSAEMVNHSLFIWILNPLPLIGILTCWLIVDLAKYRHRLINVFFLGLLSGLGFNLQYLFFPFALVLPAICLFLLRRNNLLVILLFAFGFVIGDFTQVVFDLRHDFYHLRTLWQYFLDVYLHKTISGYINYYDFFYLFPIAFLLLAFLTRFLYRINKPLAFAPIVIFLYYSFTSPLFNLYRSTGMAPGLTLAKLEQAAAAIAADQPPERFNVATIWDFDTRAHPFRYLLKYYYKYTPQPYENYADIDALYVFAPADYDITKPAVWELKTYLPYQVKELPSSTSGYRLYKLTK